MVRRSRSTATSICLCVVLALGGGTAAAAGSDYDIGRQKLHSATDDYARTVVEGGLFGAATGAMGGALVGAMQGGGRNFGRDVLIGVAVAGVTGLVNGLTVAEAKKRYTGAEDNLDQAIRKARQRNEKLARVVASADQLVTERRAELAELRSDASAERRAELQRAVDGDISVLDAALIKARTARDQAAAALKSYRDAPAAAEMRRESVENNTAVKRLAKDHDALAQVRNEL